MPSAESRDTALAAIPRTRFSECLSISSRSQSGTAHSRETRSLPHHDAMHSSGSAMRYTWRREGGQVMVVKS